MQSYKEYILGQTSEADLYAHYVPTYKGKTGSFTSPFKPDEKNPSFSIRQNGAGLKWKAHNEGDERQGDVWELVAQLKGLDCKRDFIAVCEAVAADMGLSLPERKPDPEMIFEPTTFPDFTPDFIAYWAQFKVTPEVLNRYGVKQAAALKNAASIKRNLNNGWPYRNKAAALFTGGSATARKIIVPADAATGQKTKQVYNSPDSAAAYIFGIEQAEASKPETLIICEGEKDALVLAAHGFNAVCFASATTRPTAAQIERIKTTGSKVFICYDTDEAGRKGAAKIQQLTGFPVVQLPSMEPGKNDIADYFSEGHSAADFSALLEAATTQPEGINKAGEKEKMSANVVESDFVKYVLGNIKPTAVDLRDLYKPLTDKDGNIRGIEINHNRFNERLKSFGFTRYDLPDDTPIIVHVKDNIVSQVRATQVEDVFFAWLLRGPETVGGYAREEIYNKFLKGNDSYFSEKKLYRLGLRQLEFKTDSRTETFFYFRNGFVRCTKDNYSLHPYKELNGQIWRDQIREMDFIEQLPTNAPEAGIFARFLYNVCKHSNDKSEAKRQNRFNQLLAIAGYMMHHYFDGPRIMPILTDSSLSAGDNGGSGKTIFLKALAQMKPADLIDGKTFKPKDDKHVFQTVRQQHQIVALNDVVRGFEIEPIYTAITEGIKVEPKGKPPYFINAKIIVSSNAAVILKGGSDRRRVLDFEFSDHYHEGYRPENDFPGKHFFAPDEQLFTAQDWTDFYNLMCYAASVYHMAGLPKVEQVNLDRRRLEQETNPDFINWMDDQIEQGKIKMGEWCNKSELHHAFLIAYPDYKESRYLGKQRHFTDCIRKYKAHSKELLNHHEEQEKRSDKDQFIIFLPAKV